MSSTTSKNAALMVAAGGLAAAAAISMIMYYMSTSSSSSSKSTIKDKQASSSPKSIIPTTSSSRDLEHPTTPQQTTTTGTATPLEEEQTPLVDNSANSQQKTKQKEERTLHARIEELDKKGKALFKNKQFVAAAETFTEALDLIGDYDSSTVGTASLSRQLITLLNNRSAMYEKASMPELALDDCSSILELEAGHGKARTRKLRILEAMQRWYDCLVEICAMQLLFMQANRNQLRMGLPTPPPPVPQSKMEEILSKLVPEQVKLYGQNLVPGNNKPLPSTYTILQLLKSYTGYNKWMAEAAKDGSVAKMAPLVDVTDADTAAQRATQLFQRGRRHVYDGDYESAILEFEEAHRLLETYEAQKIRAFFESDAAQARILEWAGMARHWQYRLDAATECYEKASDLDPNNAWILVKQAGVAMDASLQDQALKLFEMALALDPNCADALLHRSNLYMIQGKPELAKADLEKCVRLYPNHVMARLRLASILAATQNADAAQDQLDAAERVEPNSSEVQSYRGELYFTQGEMAQARQQFEKAIKLEPNNPTPYVNCAMAILNTPPSAVGNDHQPAMEVKTAISLLEQAVAVDPQFMAAYVQLGQLKLGTATELSAARQVIALYDQALGHCRTAEDLKELCSMRILAVAQVEAATQLKMESFNLQ